MYGVGAVSGDIQYYAVDLPQSYLVTNKTAVVGCHAERGSIRPRRMIAITQLVKFASRVRWCLYLRRRRPIPGRMVRDLGMVRGSTKLADVSSCVLRPLRARAQSRGYSVRASVPLLVILELRSQ